MALTAQDIHKKKFSFKMRGYNIDEVNDFLEQIQKDYQIILDENQKLKSELKDAKHELTYYDDLKNSLNQSILVAQEAADKVKKDAELEADSITNKAREKATELVNNATDQSNDILEDSSKEAKGLAIATDDFRDNIKTFRKNIIGMLTSQLEFAKSEDWETLLNASDYKNYDEIKKAIKNIDNQSLKRLNSESENKETKTDKQPKKGVTVKTVSGDYDDPTVVIYPNNELEENQ